MVTLMKKTLIFAKRNLIEMSRDTLSYIFCIIFPIVMLIVMTLVNESIPVEANMTIFRIDRLAGGVIVFGQTFVMLFTALTVSKDRNGSFLVRMFAAPMKPNNFTSGYILPMLAVSLIQTLVTFIAALIISLITGTSINPLALLLLLPAVLPSALMFSALGLLFGTLFSEKAAPGLCSIVISLGSFIGGIWFDAEAAGGVLLTICKGMPFLYCTKVSRAAIALDFSAGELIIPELIVCASALVLVLLSAIAFKKRMKADLA